MRPTATRLGSLLLLSGLFLGRTAGAETLNGKITAVDTAKHSLTISRDSAASDIAEEVDISVGTSAKFKGVTSLSDLKIGDRVRLEATQNASTLTWQANYVEK